MEPTTEADLSPNRKRPKLTTTETLKGKEKIVVVGDADDRHLLKPPQQEEEGNGGEGGGGRTCGICFSEEGERSIPGQVDSCDHYFCFVCIMEWSKIESRCPLCKKRFSSILRPPVPSLFPVHRLVRIPERNQVYHPLGNASEGPADLYAEACCSYCQKSSDDSLLLLCDLCDSAAHTFCVGLGYDVPEGDWYCEDCMVSKNEHSKTESDDDCSRFSGDNSRTCRLSLSPISISEVVAEEDPPISPQPSFCATDSERIGGSGLGSNGLDIVANLHCSSSQPEQRSLPARISDVARKDGRTLRRCRDVHRHIQRLRENWNGLRNGSLSFGSVSNRTGNDQQIDRKRTDPSISRSRLPVTNSRAPQTSQDRVPDVSACSTSSSDVDKAWRMMKAAKSLQLGLKRDRGCAPSNKGRCTNLTIPEARSAGIKANSTIVDENGSRHISAMVDETELKFSNDPVKRKGGDISRKYQVHKECQRIDGKESFHLTPAKKKAHVAEKTVHVISEDRTLAGASNSFPGPGPGPDNSTAYVRSSVFYSSKAGCNELLPHEEASKGKVVSVKDRVSSSKVASSDAKSEVQSIVKLNLKLQKIDKHLGSEGFKKAARVATHTILAACGLEHSESIARKVPKTTCKHSEQLKHAQPSKLMPGSCRECFYAFAGDVVANISSELMTQTL